MIIRVEGRCVWRVFRRALAQVMIVAGCGGMLVWVWGLLEPTLYQHIQKLELEQEFQQALENPAPSSLNPNPGDPRVLFLPKPRRAGPPSAIPWFRRDPLALGQLEVPRLSFSVIVREGMDDETLRKAAGHVPFTALPGEAGNFVVLGHRDTLFRPLRGLEHGDKVRILTARGAFLYSVDSIAVVEAEDVKLPEGSEQGITLVTCYPFDFIGPAPQRFVAHGHLE